MQNLKINDTNELTYEIEKRLTDLQNELMAGGVGVDWEFGMTCIHYYF